MHNVTTCPRSSWCMDACSVYNRTTRRCRVVSPWSVFKKGLTEQPQAAFVSPFPPSWKTQLADCKCCIHQRRLQTMRGRTGLWPRSFESAVGRGGAESAARGGCGGWWWWWLGRPTGRVGELGEVGSPLAVE